MQKASILIVDDDRFYRELYAEMLTQKNYLIESAQSGAEALGKIRSKHFDLVLTDLFMPGIDGIDLLRRAMTIDNPPEVILVTGHATVETAIQALKNGARDYLFKPCSPEEIRHTVEAALKQRSLLSENSQLKEQILLFQRGQDLAAQIDISTLLTQAVDIFCQETGNTGFACLWIENEPCKIGAYHGYTEEQALAVAKPALGTLQAAKEIQHLSTGTAEKFLLLPLICENKTQGAILLAGVEMTAVRRTKISFLWQQLSIGFSNASLFKQTREQIYIDELTGLRNYRYLHLILDEEIHRCNRYELQFSIIFLDLDHFKQVNDTYGHMDGSRILKEVAVLLRETVREADITLRYGGDEFIVILVETDSSGAAIAAERLRHAVDSHSFDLGGKASLHLTATIGYATFPQHARTKKEIIELADQAMYHGKERRNTACSAHCITGDTPPPEVKKYIRSDKS